MPRRIVRKPRYFGPLAAVMVVDSQAQTWRLRWHSDGSPIGGDTPFKSAREAHSYLHRAFPGVRVVSVTYSKSYTIFNHAQGKK